MTTQYLAPVSLWLVVRKRFSSTGLFIEPACVGREDEKGPVVFISRMLAATYAYIRNTYHGPDDSDGWRVIPLQEFDLLGYARAGKGEDKDLVWCMMSFGFSMEDTASLIVKTGAPRVRYVPLPFRPPADAEAITFRFNQWVFDFIHKEFITLGFGQYETDFERVDEMDETTFQATLKLAISRVNVCHEPTGQHGSLWGSYSAALEMWVSGAENEEEGDDLQRTAHEAPRTLQ